MTSRRGGALVFLAAALVASGCNSRLIRPPATIFADGGERAVSASVGDAEGRFGSVLTSFFPSVVPLHPGDSVNFDVRDSGEPHTVALGTLVDEALTALDTLEAGAGPAGAEALPQMQALPTVLPRSVEGGRPLANRSAAQRCFLHEGEPPVGASGGAPACPDRDQPDFDGTQTFYSGGYLREGEPFRVKLSPEIRPGIYSFMCLVHRAAMTGAIDVRSPDIDRPPVAELRRQAQNELDEALSTLSPVARRVVVKETGPVLAGAGPEGRARGFLAAFFPEELSVRAGESVTWEPYGMHSISFSPERDAREGLLVNDRDGVRINLEAWRPVRGPAQPPAAVAYPPTQAEVSVDGGSWSGEGAFSSGVLRSYPPARVSYTLRFTEPGAYRYVCLVHQRMRGTIVVR